MFNPDGLESHNSGSSQELLPKAPQYVKETELDFLFLVELLCKTLFFHGQMRLVELVNHTKLSISVLEPLLAFMRTEQLCEVSGRSDTEATIAFNLTDVGRSRAQTFLQKSHYAGPAPVSLVSYIDMVHKQSIGGMKITKELVAEGFEGFVLRQSTLDQFGAAMNSGRAIFVYGPAGSGKTYVSEHLATLLTGYTAIPHAVEINGEVVQIFDPLVHKPVSNTGAVGSLDRGVRHDPRWVLCQRPVVITGGELTLSMLDLEFDQNTRFYQAPPQVKANNGLLIIDDLGRQLVSPQTLMNRWIVPLDRKVDYLALHTGTKFMVPFDVIVIFSSNIPPSQLADEAFLRRLGYKIYIGELHENEYRTIFEQNCNRMNIPFSEAGLRFVIDQLHTKHDKPLLACIPRDLLEQVRDFAFYQGVEPELSEKMLSWAWENYYTRG
ncbi:ATP-binding protein [Pseudogulbenkiania ferrooxidans]|uniref:AAA ATPase n=1 Tax=Pseudogulbenkiania ferrooxidans 2002 TaxID=279714 RepID=B9YZS2_9NEIS|nr:ATP-binding protein [Pseudogulbenkiania ferrooxidans]EEG09805.1 AAA ATPase [Pseudogulbenkiania ferrooxidans 2002]